MTTSPDTATPEKVDYRDPALRMSQLFDLGSMRLLIPGERHRRADRTW